MNENKTLKACKFAQVTYMRTYGRTVMWQPQNLVRWVTKFASYGYDGACRRSAVMHAWGVEKVLVDEQAERHCVQQFF